MKTVAHLDLTPYNSYGLCAQCAHAYFPESEEDVREFYRSNPGRGKILLGSGHNVILSREWYDEDFLIFNGNFDRIEVEGTVMVAEAGAFSKKMSETALAHALTGFEMFYDIPSSLGGAIVMNAGASGQEIKDLVVSIRYLDLRTLEIQEITASEAGFGYRQSIFQGDSQKVVLQARLQLSAGDPARIAEKMEAMRQARWAKQPRDYPTAGSVFRRPTGKFVGPMIEQLGLKGHRVGGASISEKHAGIFVNSGGATGADIVELIEYTRSRVREAFDTDLKPEQVIL